MPVLLRQHFRGRHQDGLVLIRHGNQDRVNGDGGLAGADIPLQKPLHRPIPGQVGADLAHGLILVGGEAKRKEPSNPRIDSAADGKRRGPLAIAQVAATEGQGQLKDEEFLVNKAPSAGIGVGHRLGKVDLLQSLLDWRETAPLTKFCGQDLRDLAAVKIDGLANDGPELLRAKLFGQGINRHHRRRAVLERAVQDLDARVGHLPMIAKPLGFATEGQPLAIAKGASRIRLVEPGTFDTMLALAQHHADDTAAVRELPAFDLHHFSVDGLHGTR